MTKTYRVRDIRIAEDGLKRGAVKGRIGGLDPETGKIAIIKSNAPPEGSPEYFFARIQAANRKKHAAEKAIDRYSSELTALGYVIYEPCPKCEKTLFKDCSYNTTDIHYPQKVECVACGNVVRYYHQLIQQSPYLSYCSDDTSLGVVTPRPTTAGVKDTKKRQTKEEDE